jgi:general secretion pathway protein H
VRRRTWSAGSSDRAAAAGFTLIELLVVLMIAGLLLAVTPPLISNAIPGVQLKSAARTLVSALRQTRSLAISEAMPKRLTVDLQAREVRIPGRAQAIDIPAKIDVELTVAESQRSGEHTAAVSFFPDGSSTGGRIRLGRADIHYQVDVDWLTGRVSLLE